MITSRALTEKQIESIWKDFCSVQALVPDSKVVPDRIRHWWEDKKKPFWRWNGRDGRPTLFDEMDYLRMFLATAETYVPALLKAVEAAKELSEQLEQQVLPCPKCKGVGRTKGRHGKRYHSALHSSEDCPQCDGWGMVTLL